MLDKNKMSLYCIYYLLVADKQNSYADIYIRLKDENKYLPWYLISVCATFFNHVHIWVCKIETKQIIE